MNSCRTGCWKWVTSGRMGSTNLLLPTNQRGATGRQSPGTNTINAPASPRPGHHKYGRKRFPPRALPRIRADWPEPGGRRRIRQVQQPAGDRAEADVPWVVDASSLHVEPSPSPRERAPPRPRTLNSNDPNNAAQQYGLSGGYYPQRLAVNYSWDLPFGHPDGLKGKLVSGWNLSGVTILQDGEPLTITDTRGGTIFGSVSTSRAEFAREWGLQTWRLREACKPGWAGASPVDQATSIRPHFAPHRLIGNGTGYGNSGVWHYSWAQANSTGIWPW